MVNPVHIYIDNQTIEVQHERGYHLKDGSVFVELEDPMLTIELDGTDEQWRESLARLGSWLTKRREEQS